MNTISPVALVLSEWEIRAEIFKPDLKSSPGEDQVKVGVIRKLWRDKEVKDTKVQVFQNSLCDFPSLWKSAVICPTPKEGGSFRPMSLLLQISKVIERIIACRLV
jgi:hypothetical protein